jgi:sulfur transfer complex TusBCD TusB component (DsrH family)
MGWLGEYIKETRDWYGECTKTLKRPEVKKEALALYAWICGCSLLLGLENMLGGWLLWRDFTNRAPLIGSLVALVAPLLIPVPLLVWIWRGAAPERGLFRDWRAWLATAGGVLGLFLVEFENEGSSPWYEEVPPGMMAIFTLLIGAFIWAILVLGVSLVPRLGKTYLERAERRGWRPERHSKVGLEWQQVWWKEMSARERWACGLIYFLAFVGVMVAYFILALSDHFGAAIALFCSFGAVVMYDQAYVMGGMFHEKKRHLFELQAARQMQLSLMPAKDPDVEGLDISGVSIPAEEVGGDLYDYFEPSGPPGSVGITVGDVSGKAMKAAIATVLVSGMLRSEYGRAGGPSEILRNLNHSLRGGLEANGFVAMQILTLAPRERIANYTNAGQVYPLLRRGGKLRYFGGGALPLGIAGEAEFKDASVLLEAGDVLLLVSDGITEAMNEQRALFGFERLETALLGLPGGLSARGMIDSILAQVRTFTGKAKQHDDMTIVVVKVM